MRKLRLALVLVALLALLGTEVAWAAPSASGLVHIVQPGENLFRIARRYGTTVSAIAAANGIADPSHIVAGQRLTIPTGWHGGSSHGSSGGGGVYIVRCGDTLSGIAWRFGVNMWALAHANGIRNPNRIYAGQRLVIPHGGYYPCTSCGTHYRVRCGDTLYSIAWRYGTTVWAIAHANGLRNPNLIYAGQVLYIP